MYQSILEEGNRRNIDKIQSKEDAANEKTLAV